MDYITVLLAPNGHVTDTLNQFTEAYRKVVSCFTRKQYPSYLLPLKLHFECGDFVEEPASRIQ